MNKRLIWFISFTLVMAIFALRYLSNQPTPIAQRSPVKIGANLALTSSYPSWSKQISAGLDLAITQYNLEHPGESVTLIIEDNQGKANLAVSAFHKLATIDRVSIVVSTHTPLTQPLQQIAATEKLPLLGTVVSAVGFGDVNEWCFLDWPTHDNLTPPVAAYAYENLQLRKAATLVVNDDYGLDGARQFAAKFLEKNGRITTQETFSNQDTNLRDQLSRILAGGAELIYTVGREQQLIAVVRQAREMGFKGIFAGVNAFDAPDIWNTLGKDAEGIVFSGVGAADTTSVQYTRFENSFELRFGRKPDWIATYGFTIGEYLAPIAASSNGDRVKIRTALSTLKRNTLRGTIGFAANRSIQMPVVLYKRVNGRNELAK